MEIEGEYEKCIIGFGGEGRPCVCRPLPDSLSVILVNGIPKICRVVLKTDFRKTEGSEPVKNSPPICLWLKNLHCYNSVNLVIPQMSVVYAWGLPSDSFQPLHIGHCSELRGQRVGGRFPWRRSGSLSEIGRDLESSSSGIWAKNRVKVKSRR